MSNQVVYGNLDDTIAKKRATSAKKPGDQHEELPGKDIGSLKMID